MQVFGWAPITAGIYFTAGASDILCIVAGWCIAASSYLERRQLGYEDTDINDEWAFYYEYHDWLIQADLPVPRFLELRIAYIDQHLVQ